MRVLIVRLSSMGDVVQTLPALTEAAKHIPDIRFDWVLDESFAEIARWHPLVDNIIISNHRKWRRNFKNTLKNGEIIQFIKNLRAKKYDYVVDLQTGYKSAVVTRLAKGLRCGYTKEAVREKGAQWAYQKQFFVPKKMHTIHRMRSLLALALNYKIDILEAPDYGIDVARLETPELELPKPYLVFVHFASWDSKNWPENYWKKLIETATQNGFFIVLPWGNETEKQRAFRLAEHKDNVLVLPSLTISQKANILAHAQAVVGCDTGLSHIAAALETPTITLHGPTDPELGGAIGKNLVPMISQFECLKCDKDRCSFDTNAKTTKIAACFLPLTPEMVWQQLEKFL